jgi:alkylhydroperoxidase family enzyme
MGVLNTAITRAMGAATGGRSPNVFTTLAHNRRLFRRWLFFASALMPGGRLPRRDSELVILRVAHNCRSAYEWEHHQRLGGLAGLSSDEIARVREGPQAAGWTPRQSLLLRVADELHDDRTLSDETWKSLSVELSPEKRIELCMLVGHYEMLAMTLNALAVESDPTPTGGSKPSPAVRLLARRRRSAEERSR